MTQKERYREAGPEFLPLYPGGGGGGALVAKSCLTLYNPMDCIAHQAPLSMGFLRRADWSGLHSLLQGIFPTGDRSCVSCTAVGVFAAKPSGKPFILSTQQ